ncbi:MAG: hypothetical protein ACJ789_02450 [Thermomicrobiales bacterium]
MTTQRGHVPQPPCMEHYQARINAIAGLNCTEMARPIAGTAWHTEVGTFLGTAGWFDDPHNRALTDFQIGGPTDGHYDGVIMRFIEADQGVAPYANGPVGKVRPPFDDALLFLNVFGYGEAINARLRSIELADGGMPNRDRELSGRQIESLAFLTAYVHSEEAGQGWEEFAHNILHYQTGTDHVDCPGAWVKTHKVQVRARVVEIMHAYQTGVALARPLLITYPPSYAGPQIAQPGEGAPQPLYAKPLIYPWLTDEAELDKGIDRKIGSTTAFALRRAWTAMKETPRYRDSSSKAQIGPPIAKGTTFTGEFVYKSNGEWWVLTAYGTRVRMSDLSPNFELLAA